MTAEIAIMNKMAIALAADSAITIETQDGEKVFNTVNKLFRLSKYHPVGIMIYGNAEFMNTPWETIIKVFRSQLKNQRFDTLDNYADQFIRFLSGGSKIIPKSAQESYYREIVSSLFLAIREQINEDVKGFVKIHNKISEKEIKNIASQVIASAHKEWESYGNLPAISTGYPQKVLNTYQQAIDKILEIVFEKLPIYKSDKALLYKIGINIAIKNRFSTRSSGVVIAGFGEKKFFHLCVHTYLKDFFIII